MSYYRYPVVLEGRVLAFNSTGSLVTQVQTIIRPRTHKFLFVRNPCSSQISHDPPVPSRPSRHNPFPPVFKFRDRQTVNQGVPFCLPEYLPLLISLAAAQFVDHVLHVIANMPYA